MAEGGVEVQLVLFQPHRQLDAAMDGTTWLGDHPPQPNVTRADDPAPLSSTLST